MNLSRRQIQILRRLRYVMEKGWERGQFGFERDAQDHAAAIGLLIDTRGPDPLPLGTVRLIAADRTDSREVSRFCVSRPATAPVLNCLPLALIAWAWAASDRRRVTRWTALVDTRLLKALIGLGLTFDRVGDPVEHHGRRHPVETSVAALFGRCRTQRPDVAAFLDRGRLACAAINSGQPGGPTK